MFQTLIGLQPVTPHPSVQQLVTSYLSVRAHAHTHTYTFSLLLTHIIKSSLPQRRHLHAWSHLPKTEISS